jgi:acetyl-CoA acetyltransferase
VSASLRGGLSSACIVGIGETKYFKRGTSPMSDLELGVRAVLAAVQDSGLPVASIDGLATYSSTAVSIETLASTLGLPRLRFANYWPGGGGGVAAVAMNAALAVASGVANYVVCYRTITQTSERRYGQSRKTSASGLDAFKAPFGMLSPAQNLAPRARRYMHETAATSEDFASIPLASYSHAQRNSRAVMHGRPLTLETYLESRMIADPFRLFDCCQETDGAAAYVVTTHERARDLAQKPVHVLAGVQGSGSRQEFGAPNILDYPTADLSRMAKDLFSQAGISPDQLDVLQIYENFGPLVLMAIEDLGLCGRGEGPDFARGGRFIWPDGKLPLNTSGGNLAEGYIHGFELVNEAVRQLRGSSTCQVPDAETCLVAGGPAALMSSAMILGRAG